MIDLSSKRLPNTVAVGDAYFSIKTDFRVWLKFDKELSKATQEYTPDFSFVLEEPQTVTQELFNALLDFYLNKNKYPVSNGKSEKVFDYIEDGEYMLSEFRTKYNIDLLTVKIHWHEFLALFRGLFTSFSQIVSYRSYEGTDKQYLSMKTKWRIQEERKKDSRSKQMEDILRNGGDLSQLGR